MNLGTSRNLSKILGDLKENVTRRPDILESVFAAMDVDRLILFSFLTG